MKILKYLKIIFNNYLILIGAAMLFLYFWARFVRERLPKDIPYILTDIGFCILLYICCIYAYIIISYIRSLRQKSASNNKLNIIPNALLKPLEDFDYFFKQLSFVKNSYRKFGLWLAYKLRFFIKNTNIFYNILYILPRLIFICVLFIDIFFFHKLYYIYKIIILGILPLLNRYIIYSLKLLKKDLITELKKDVDTVITDYEFGIHPSE